MNIKLQNRYKNLLIIILLIFCFSNDSAGKGNISLEAKVDRNKIKIGDLIKYSIVVTRDEDVEVEMPGLGANLGAFEIRQ